MPANDLVIVETVKYDDQPELRNAGRKPMCAQEAINLLMDELDSALHDHEDHVYTLRINEQTHTIALRYRSGPRVGRVLYFRHAEGSDSALGWSIMLGFVVSLRTVWRHGLHVSRRQTNAHLARSA